MRNGFEREHSYSKTVNKGHGCIKTRECWAIDNEEYLALVRKREQWKGLKSIARIVSQSSRFLKVEMRLP